MSRPPPPSKQLTSWRRWRRLPMSSGREASLLLLAMRTRRGRRHRQEGKETSWFRLGGEKGAA